MAKKPCKNHMDVIGLLGDRDRRENELFGLDSTKPMSPWGRKIVRRLLEMARTKDSPINDKRIKEAIIKEWGTLDKRKYLAFKYAALLENHPGLEEQMDEFLRMEVSLIKDPGKIEWKDVKNELKLDLSTLPEGVLKGLVNEIQGRIRHGFGENIGKSFLWGALGPLDIQLTTPKTMARKDASGAIFQMWNATKEFPRALARQLERFSGEDPTHQDYVPTPK